MDCTSRFIIVVGAHHQVKRWLQRCPQQSKEIPDSMVCTVAVAAATTTKMLQKRNARKYIYAIIGAHQGHNDHEDGPCRARTSWKAGYLHDVVGAHHQAQRCRQSSASWAQCTLYLAPMPSRLQRKPRKFGIRCTWLTSPSAEMAAEKPL